MALSALKASESSIYKLIRHDLSNISGHTSGCVEASPPSRSAFCWERRGIEGRGMLDEKVRELQCTWNAPDLAWGNPNMFDRVPLRNLSA